MRFRLFFRRLFPPVVFSAVLVSGVLVPVLLWLALPGAARAESFFPEIAALREDSYLSLRFSERTFTFNHDSPAAFERQQETSEVGSSGNLRGEYVGLGAMFADREFLERNGYRLYQEETIRAVYLAMMINEVMLGNDRLTLVLSTDYRNQTYEFETYVRREAARNRYRLGALYQTGFVLAGYAHGRNLLELDVEDPQRPIIINEEYHYDASVKVFGLNVGDDYVGMSVIWERMDGEATEGEQVNLEKMFADHVQARIGLGVVSLGSSQTRFEAVFSPEAARRMILQEVNLGFHFSPGFSLTYSESERQEEVEMIILNIPLVNTTLHTSSSLTFAWYW